MKQLHSRISKGHLFSGFGAMIAWAGGNMALCQNMPPALFSECNPGLEIPVLYEEVTEPFNIPDEFFDDIQEFEGDTEIGDEQFKPGARILIRVKEGSLFVTGTLDGSGASGANGLAGPSLGQSGSSGEAGSDGSFIVLETVCEGCDVETGMVVIDGSILLGGGNGGNGGNGNLGGWASASIHHNSGSGGHGGDGGDGGKLLIKAAGLVQINANVNVAGGSGGSGGSGGDFPSSCDRKGMSDVNGDGGIGGMGGCGGSVYVYQLNDVPDNVLPAISLNATTGATGGQGGWGGDGGLWGDEGGDPGWGGAGGVGGRIVVSSAGGDVWSSALSQAHVDGGGGGAGGAAGGGGGGECTGCGLDCRADCHADPSAGIGGWPGAGGWGGFMLMGSTDPDGILNLVGANLSANGGPGQTGGVASISPVEITPASCDCTDGGSPPPGRAGSAGGDGGLFDLFAPKAIWLDGAGLGASGADGGTGGLAGFAGRCVCPVTGNPDNQAGGQGGAGGPGGRGGTLRIVGPEELTIDGVRVDIFGGMGGQGATGEQYEGLGGLGGGGGGGGDTLIEAASIGGQPAVWNQDPGPIGGDGSASNSCGHH